MRKFNFFFIIVDVEKKLLDVDFENILIVSIVYDIGYELDIDMFILNLFENVGIVIVKVKNILFDVLLNKLFEIK